MMCGAPSQTTRIVTTGNESSSRAASNSHRPAVLSRRHLFIWPVGLDDAMSKRVSKDPRP